MANLKQQTLEDLGRRFVCYVATWQVVHSSRTFICTRASVIERVVWYGPRAVMIHSWEGNRGLGVTVVGHVSQTW